MMITLYFSPQSRATNVLSLLRLMGQEEAVTIEIVQIQRQDGQGGQDPRNPHPEGKVPVLQTEQGLIREQGAIMLWLTDHFDHALGRNLNDPNRGSYLSWLSYYGSVIEPAMYLGFLELGDNPMIYSWCRDTNAVVANLEAALSARPFVVDDRISAADLLISAPYSWFPDFMPDSSLVRDWVARCQAVEDREFLDAFEAKAMAELGLTETDYGA